MIIVAKGRPITTPSLLASINRLQLQIAKNKAVDSVAGPGAILSTSDQLKAFEPSLNHSAAISEKSKRDLVTLINGLGQAGAGSAQLKSGLATASSGATQLNSGSGQAQSGASQLHAGLAQARGGSATLANGLKQALAGAIALRNGASQALGGATQLASGLGKGAPQVTAGLPAIGLLATSSASTQAQIKTLQGQAQTAQSSVSSALSALKGISSSDPGYQAAVSRLQAADSQVSSITSGLTGALNTAASAAFIASGVKSQVGALAPQLTAAASGAAQLEAGIGQLRAGNAQLATGLGQLSGGGGRLTSGLTQLSDGAGQLQTGLGLLTNGTGRLASGLAGGVGPAGELTSGLGEMQAAVVKSRGQIPSTAALKKLEAESPGLFSSGYFVLAAAEGATASDRNAATFTVNLLKGGTAGQIMVVSKYPASDARTRALAAKLAAIGTAFGRTHDTQVALGGPGGGLTDLTNVAESRIWLDIAVMAASIALILALALRAIVLPIVTTGFALLTTAATFGTMQLLFGGSAPLGGPGHLDPLTIIGVFTIAFSVTIVLATVLLTRTREALMAGAGGAEAARSALHETGSAATGAGLAMIAVLIPFATTGFIQVRAFGVGVAIAILLDIVIVRPVLLPAAEAVLGRFGWWPTKRPASGGPSPGPEREPAAPSPARPPQTPIHV
jgi:X-X-X-Leu-X-X-Gly heptad repeat protein